MSGCDDSTVCLNSFENVIVVQVRDILRDDTFNCRHERKKRKCCNIGASHVLPAHYHDVLHLSMAPTGECLHKHIPPLILTWCNIVRRHGLRFFHDSTCNFRRRLEAQTSMSGQRILRKFPFPLNLGTDICNVNRIRRILESSRGVRFVQRILNDDERGHPKIQCILNNGPPQSVRQSAKSPGPTIEHHTNVAAAHGKNPSPSKPTPNLDEMQLAATFMAGRYGRHSSSDQRLKWNPVNSKEPDLIY